ncbi:hypothetical protein [Streptomyces vinaceus]|uniref:hypothetical protein n=1 Tax=Streptomyces vinaceus TaxID=1960 RepID=UPI0036B9A80C
MGHVLLGIGSLCADPAHTSPGMEFVALPRGATLLCYSDADRAPGVDAREWPWVPCLTLDSGAMTSNMVLHHAGENWSEAVAASSRFAGHAAVRAGSDGNTDTLPLCSGTPETCPTSPEQVLEQDMAHDCDGVLGLLQGEIHWVAGPGHVARWTDGTADGDPYGVFGGPDRSAVDGTNRATVEQAHDRQEFPFVFGNSLLLVGDRHDEKHENIAWDDPDSIAGRFIVLQAGGLSDVGGFIVAAVPPERQDPLRSAIERFSDKEVLFHGTETAFDALGVRER